MGSSVDKHWGEVPLRPPGSRTETQGHLGPSGPWQGLFPRTEIVMADTAGPCPRAHRHLPEISQEGRDTETMRLAEGVKGGNQAGGQAGNFLAAQGKRRPLWGSTVGRAFPAASCSPPPRRRAQEHNTPLSQDPLLWVFTPLPLPGRFLLTSSMARPQTAPWGSVHKDP